MKHFLCLVLATVLALLLPAVQFSQIPLPLHVNGFAQTEGVVRQTAPSLFQPRANMANNNQNQYDTLDDAVLAAVKGACTGVSSWHTSPFLPETKDLTGIVLEKLYTYARPHLESIWSNPDPNTGGYLGLLRFAWKVAEHAAIDQKRRNEARAPEILAARLDAPILNQDGEQITMADLITDDEGTFQAFQFEDLRERLNQREYELLYESIVNRATQKDIAQQTGVTDSTISRQYAHAKEKAAKWVQWLSKRTAKQARANIHPTFSRKPCLRPDGISRDNVERWNDGLHVGEFRDPANEWRPAISNQPHVRAKKGCWNSACQNGPAIGPDNLVLPSSRRHEAVRFLPARTGKANVLCTGCKAAEREQRKVLSRPSESTEPSLFGRTKPNANWVERETENAMNHTQAAELIKQHDIPRSTVARLGRLHLSDLSGWLNDRTDISQDKVERVTQVVDDIVRVIKALPYKVDLRDPVNVQKLIVAVNDKEAQIELFPFAASESSTANAASAD